MIGLLGVKPPVEFGERTRDCTPGQAGKEGPQLNDLKSLLPDFEGVGVARDDGKETGEYSAVFYRKSVFDALDSGTF